MSKKLVITNVEAIVGLRLSPDGEEWIIDKSWENDKFYYIELRQIASLPVGNIVILSKTPSELFPNQPKEFRTYTLQGLNKTLELSIDFISDKYKLLQAISIVTFENQT